MSSKIKQCFLQACMNHGSIESVEALKILKTICEKLEGTAPTSVDDFKKFVNQLNRELSEYNQSLTFIKHSIVNREFLVFNVTLETDISKRQSHLNDSDRYVFTKLVEALVEEPNYSLDMGSVYSVLFDTNSSQRLVNQRAHMRDLLELWTHQGYFLKDEDALYLGPRLIVEFSAYMKKNFPQNVQDCQLCHRLVFWDVKCSHCNTKVHRDCIRRYLAKNSNCPVCCNIWNTRLSVAPE